MMGSFFGPNRGDFKPGGKSGSKPGSKPRRAVARGRAMLGAWRDVFKGCAMPDALHLLKTRRSVKPIELTGPGPDAAEIETLLTIAARVPDHGKLAPWRFIVFAGEARHAAGEAIAEVFRADHPDATAEQVAFERNRLARAPLVVAVVSRAAEHVKIPLWEQELSAGAAAMNLLTAAHALGYAGSWITEWYAYDRRVLERFGIDGSERIAGYVHIGRPVRNTPSERPRPALSSVVSYYDGTKP
jgi:nitroreductase